MSAFSERLALLRNEEGITQEKFAKIIGVSKSTVSMYENGNRTPSFEIEEKIADYFNVDLEFLRGRSNIRNKYQYEIKKETKKSFDPYFVDTSMLTEAELTEFNKVTGVNKQLFFNDVDEEHDMALFKQSVVEILIKQRDKKKK